MAAVCHSCHGLKVQASNDTFTLSVKSLRAVQVGKAGGCSTARDGGRSGGAGGS